MKKNLLFAMILAVGFVMAGCGSTEENRNTLVKEDTVQNGSVGEMERMSKMRILVVEDDKDMNRLITKRLKNRRI